MHDACLGKHKQYERLYHYSFDIIIFNYIILYKYTDTAKLIHIYKCSTLDFRLRNAIILFVHGIREISKPYKRLPTLQTV